MTEHSQPDYEVVMQRNRAAAMRDGVRLATDVYLPARDGEALAGPWPTLLTRTPYDKAAFAAEGDWWARRGYARVMQDVRGRFASEGDFYLLKNEAEDGYDTIEWLAAQPWSSGRVGTVGTSYMGWVQSAAAALNPPHLAAMWVNQGAFNGLTSSLRQGGALELRWLAWAFWNAPVSPEAVADPALYAALDQAAVDLRGWLDCLPWRPGDTPLSLTKDYERWAIDLLTLATEEDRLWQLPSMNFERFVEQTADVPTVYSGGWYDSYTRATTESFAAFTAAKSSPQYLLMGPWTHGEATLDRSWSGDVDFGPTAPTSGNLAESVAELRMQFFDHALKGLASGWEDAPPVRLFVMGGGSGGRIASGRLDHGGAWRDEAGWPLARAVEQRWHLHGDGSLRRERPAAGAPPSQYEFDPRRPVPSISANVSSLREYAPPDPTLKDGIWPPTQRARELIQPGGADQRERAEVMGAEPPYLPTAARPDVLSFRSEPLEDDLEVTGPITVTLWVSSDARDTDFTAMLLDCYPPSVDYPEGYALRLTDSIKRLRFRRGAQREELVRPGQVVEVPIELYPTSNVFAKGHRIGIELSSSNYPRFDVNPNTGEPIGRQTHTVVARNSVWHDAAHPSRVDLPVVE